MDRSLHLIGLILEVFRTHRKILSMELHADELQVVSQKLSFLLMMKTTSLRLIMDLTVFTEVQMASIV